MGKFFESMLGFVIQRVIMGGGAILLAFWIINWLTGSGHSLMDIGALGAMIIGILLYVGFSALFGEEFGKK